MSEYHGHPDDPCYYGADCRPREAQEEAQPRWPLWKHIDFERRGRESSARAAELDKSGD